MKLLPILYFFLISYCCFSQQEEFHLKGRILDSKGNPVVDAYIINFRGLKKIVSKHNGDFNIWVQPGDSLMISHISYYRKKVFVDELRNAPIIRLQLDTINILNVVVSPNYKSDEERARENLKFLLEFEAPAFTKIKPESNPVNQMVTEHNKIMRSEAQSISILRFSPSTQIGKLLDKIKKRKKSKQYSSTNREKRNKKQEP